MKYIEINNSMFFYLRRVNRAYYWKNAKKFLLVLFTKTFCSFCQWRKEFQNNLWDGAFFCHIFIFIYSIIPINNTLRDWPKPKTVLLSRLLLIRTSSYVRFVKKFCKVLLTKKCLQRISNHYSRRFSGKCTIFYMMLNFIFNFVFKLKKTKQKAYFQMSYLTYPRFSFKGTREKKRITGAYYLSGYYLTKAFLPEKGMGKFKGRKVYCK